MQVLLEKHQKEGRPELCYLPLAVDIDRFKPGGVSTRENRLMFAGTLTASRLKTLDRLRLRGMPIVWQGPARIAGGVDGMLRTSPPKNFVISTRPMRSF